MEKIGQKTWSLVMRRIEDWKSRLIDLSRRNNLLYFRRTKSGNLSVSRPSAETVFDGLVLRNRHWEFWLPPEEAKSSDGQSELNLENSSILENHPPTANQLVSEGMSRTDLDRVLKNLNRRSLSDYRERGVRILHAAFGMLVWKEIETSEEIRSPLILVPIELSRESIREPFSISVPPVEEEAVLNPALQVKMKHDFKIELPPMPEEWDKQGLTSYFNSVTRIISELGWRVEETVEIGLFSFHKLVIYKDLDSNSELIAQHPLVRAIVGDKDVRLIQDSLPSEKDVDKIESPQETFQVLDADSSQRVSIDYALRGQSFVMQGPPGTGKSQTIANIIAQCIAQGKSVLFVSDKMAALEVVYKRLAYVGLANFCLELHSSKANKQEVVAEIKRCLDEQLIPRRLPSSHEFEKMTDLKEKLNDYIVSLHQKRPPLDKSAYEILGQLSSLERVPFISAGLTNPRSLTPQKLHELEELMSQLKNVWQVVEDKDFPWRGYRGSTYNLEIRSELSTLLDNLISTIDLLRSESAKFSAKLGLDTPSTFDQVNWLIEVGSLLKESPGPEAKWLVQPNLDQLVSEARNYQEVYDWCRTTRILLMERYSGSVFDLALGKSADLEKALSSIGKVVIPTSLEEGELLKKREKLLDFVSNTQVLAKKWREIAQELAQMFSLSAENLTLDRVKELSRIAILCFSEEKPESQWLDPSHLQQIQEMLPKTKKDYQEHNSLKNKLEKVYSDQIFKLDLDEMIKRYTGPYKGFLRWLRPSFHRDQKRIALMSREGRVSKSVVNDLLDAHRLKVLSVEIDSNAEQVHSLLGHFYKEYETDFQQAEKGVEIASEIIRLSGVTPTPENLAKLVSYGSNPQPSIKQAGKELQESGDKWDQTSGELSSIIPAHQVPGSNLSIHQTPLTKLQDWAKDAESKLNSLCEITKEVLVTCKEEPQNYKQLLEDLGKVENIRRKETEILGQKELLQQKFGFRFAGLDTNWEEISAVLQWTKKVQALFGASPIPELLVNVVSHGAAHVPSNYDLATAHDGTLKFMAALESRFETESTYQSKKLLEMDIETIHDRIRLIRNRVDNLQVWIDFKDIKNRFSQRGLDAFFNRLTDSPPPASQLVDVFRRVAYQEWINGLYDEDPCLGRFRRENHEELIAEFRRLDEELIHLSPNRVIQAANGRKPQGILIQASDSEVNTLLKEAAKKRRLMPLRNLVQKIPHILFRLKPCLLMSPISVSQFLGPELKFDLVLFDEASQIVPEDAIGSIYRGKSIVVAGDDQQLPPTSFFQKGMIEDYDWDEMNAEEGEVFDSILDEFQGIGLPVRTLRWHYRSKHEELISFSNHRFYGDTLITFPSAVAKHETLGVKLVYVREGVYDRGGRRDNSREAETVAELVFEQFRQYPKKTLGVVTFSMAQMEAVEEAIERWRKEQPEYERFFKEDRLEGFFVKNLENVQGDERDVIIFSIGYGRDQQGQMTMNFGPLNKPGGERRLNVAVTRAREKVVLVTSIKASDIDLAATSAEGVLTLFHYLDYAERGPDALKLIHPQSGEFESPLEEDVAGEIRRMGYNVIPQVGCSDYRIDIGVIDPANPGRFLLGVQCDGATYHSSYSARDRDRLREQVLKKLGWRIYRVWAPTWVARRESEIRRLKEALEQIRDLQVEKEALKADPDPVEEKETSSQEVDVRKVQFGGIEKIGVPYKVCELKAQFNPYVRVQISRYPYSSDRKNEFHFRWNLDTQSRLLAELVREEGPVHFDYAVQRLSTAWGLKRAGHKVVHATREAVDVCRREGKVILKEDFIWPVGLREVVVRVPVEGVQGSMRKPEYIPPEEIENAMRLIAQYALGISVESLIVETARVFGFNHTGEKVRERFLEVYKELLRKRKLVCANDIVTSSQV